VVYLLCLDRFLALSRRTDPNWVTIPATTKTIDANTHPILLTVKGMARMPDPMTVLMMVVTVRPKS
jgi:hypothetical protein